MWDCIIIGGGIAGLQAAIQLGRYQHRCLVLDADQGPLDALPQLSQFAGLASRCQWTSPADTGPRAGTITGCRIQAGDGGTRTQNRSVVLCYNSR